MFTCDSTPWCRLGQARRGDSHPGLAQEPSAWWMRPEASEEYVCCEVTVQSRGRRREVAEVGKIILALNEPAPSGPSDARLSPRSQKRSDLRALMVLRRLHD